MVYLWLKAFHIIFVITWMAGMLYLPRLFVYHSMVKRGSKEDQRFQLMERKLLKIIMNPSIFFVFTLGIALIFQTDVLNTDFGIWMHVKLLLVLIMAGLHGFFGKIRKDFACGKNKYSEKFYRIINELPAILMVAIVLLAVIKPF